MYNSYRLHTEEERKAARAAALRDFQVEEIPELKMIIGRQTDARGRHLCKIFYGTAGRPDCYYQFPDAERMEKFIEEQKKRRRERLDFKEEQRAKMKAESDAAKQNADLPRFEIGRRYIYEWDCDGYDCSTIVEVVNRTAQFITIREKNGKEKRIKVHADKSGEYVNDGFLYFRAEWPAPTDEEIAAMRKAEEEKTERERLEFIAYEEQIAREIAGMIEEVEPDAGTWAKIGWSESRIFRLAKVEGKRITVKSADAILKYVDDSRAENKMRSDFFKGYDKTDFFVQLETEGEAEPEQYGGRYDIGDGDGGMIAHIRAIAEAHRDETERETRLDFVNRLESTFRPVYIVDVEQTEKALGGMVDKLKEQRRQEMADIEAMIDLLPVEDIEEMARKAEDREARRFFIMKVWAKNHEKGAQLARELL